MPVRMQGFKEIAADAALLDQFTMLYQNFAAEEGSPVRLNAPALARAIDWDHSGYRGLCAQVDHQLVGLLAWSQFGPQFHVLDLFIAAPWRRQGLGQTLLEQAFLDQDFLDQAPTTKHAASVDVATGNQAAMGFYRDQGFVECEARLWIRDRANSSTRPFPASYYDVESDRWLASAAPFDQGRSMHFDSRCDRQWLDKGTLPPPTLAQHWIEFQAARHLIKKSF